MRTSAKRRRLLQMLGAVAALVAISSLPAPALAQVQPYGTNDFRGFRDVLPPGTNGLVNALQLAAYESNGTRPPHSSDQLAMYSGLTTAAPNIKPSQLGLYYKDATFGVRSGGVDSTRTESPEPGVTIIRDSAYGVPHIYGDTRAALMFGIGWATAEDRLFFIDVLRHYGRGDLASFAGGSNASMDEGVWANEPYTEQDFSKQIQYGMSASPYGRQILGDATNYVAGINAYISNAENPLNTLNKLPSEYAAIGQLPQPFTLNDLVAIATLVGGIFGNGGGAQLSNAILFENLERKFGPERLRVPGAPQLPAPDLRKRRTGGLRAHRASVAAAAARSRLSKRPSRAKPRRVVDHSGFATFKSLVDPADPEAPTTVRGRRFPYQTLPMPSKAVSKTIALPDPGSVHYVNTLAAGTAPGARDTSGSSTAERANGIPPPGTGAGLLAFPRYNSNALLVSGAHTTSGHPVAVMGPQVSYFAPEILMEEDIHGPGVDAAGAAFPGVNLYVELGHGRDYAWSATSSGQNIIDTFAVPLCNPSGGPPALGSDYYVLNGHCVQMETLTRQESWTPNAADSTPAGSATFRTLRTAFGIVIARATVHGRPVVYTNLRSTYMHELDSALGFYLFNDPSKIRNPQDFFNASYGIDYTFNWFYTDDKHIAYFNSGLNPVRAPHTDPLFPSWSTYAWQGLHGQAQMTPQSLTERQTPESAHPHTIDQEYLTSWNNKQAPGYNDAATGQQYSSIYRSQLLDQNIAHYLRRGHGKLSLTDLVNAMGNAGTQDLRGVQVLPYALAIIGRPRDPALRGIVNSLRTWVSSGAHRINRQHPGAHGNYQQSAAVRIMDAWWPLLVRAEFGPVLGSSLLNEVELDFPINDEPGHGTTCCHVGSSFDVGFYGIVQKDLRAVLHRHVAGPLNRIFCGAGSLARCRAALQSSLRAAAAESAAQVYPADSDCAAGDQMCSDSIVFRPIGAVKQPLIEWINRPTFQQADQIQGHGPR